MTKRQRIDPLPESDWDEDVRALIEQAWEGPARGNANNLFRTFARRRDLLRPWGEFGRAVYNGRLAKRDRELLVLRVAWLTRCSFVWAFHEPLAGQIGMTREEIQRVVQGPDAAGLDERESTLIRAVDELHGSSHISDATWARLEGWYDEGELVEIPVVIGGYTLVAYFTNALRIAPRDGLPELPELRNQGSKP